MILHFGDWHGEPPLVSQVYSERVLTSRVPRAPVFPQLKMAITVETDRDRIWAATRASQLSEPIATSSVRQSRILVGER